jgi:hypothetical protein
MRIRNFIEFLNEWDLSGHWKQRGSSTHEISRTRHRSVTYKSGWFCDELIETTSKGKNTANRLSAEDFFKQYMRKEEFIEKVETALQNMADNKIVREKDFQNQRVHVAVYLGKVVLEVKHGESEKYFTPLLSNFGDYGDFYQGDAVWGQISYDTGKTFFYMRGDSSYQKLLTQAIKHRKDETESEFKSRFSVYYLNSKDFVVVVPNVPFPEWKKIVEEQTNTGKTYDKHEPAAPPIETVEDKPVPSISPEAEREAKKEEDAKRKWRSHLKPKMTYVFEKGTKILQRETGKIRGVSDVMLTPDNGANIILSDEFGKKMLILRPENRIAIVITKETTERADGDLPNEGVLLRYVNISRFFKGKDAKGKPKTQVAGDVQDIFVFLPDGSIVYSKYK